MVNVIQRFAVDYFIHLLTNVLLNVFYFVSEIKMIY